MRAAGGSPSHGFNQLGLDLRELRMDAFLGVRVEGQVVFGQPTGISQRQAHVLWLYFFIPPAPARIGRKTSLIQSAVVAERGLILAVPSVDFWWPAVSDVSSRRPSLGSVRGRAKYFPRACAYCSENPHLAIGSPVPPIQIRTSIAEAMSTFSGSFQPIARASISP